MKNLLAIIVSLMLPSLCLAASCEDIECAAKAAAQARHAHTQSVLNTVIPAPEDNRSSLSSCLDSLNAIGDSYAMGISIPSMDQVFESICRECNSYIDNKIQSVTASIENEIEGALGTSHPFQVGMSASDISHALTRKLK